MVKLLRCYKMRQYYQVTHSHYEELQGNWKYWKACNSELIAQSVRKRLFLLMIKRLIKMQEFTITNQEFIKLMFPSPSYPKHNLNLHGSIKSNILSLLNYLKRWMCIPHPTSPYSNLFKNNNQTSLLNYFHFFLSHNLQNLQVQFIIENWFFVSFSPFGFSIPTEDLMEVLILMIKLFQKIIKYCSYFIVE